MNRQFENFNSQTAPSNNRVTNTSQEEYNRNQNPARTQPGTQRQVYNPNPFNGRDMVSVSSQMSNSSMLNTESSIFKPTRTGSESTNTESKKEMGVLFYSNNCNHSKTFLVNLMKTKINDSVKKICVDGNDIKLPSVIKSVPTLIARGINRPLVGEQVFAWLENEASKNVVEADVKCFSFNCKDNYTFIDGLDDGTTVDGNIAEWDKEYSINAPMDVDGDKTKKTLDDKKINKYREERNTLYGNKPLEKNTKVDPDQFNKMFLKQQQQFSNKSGADSFKQNIRNI